jgi:hypothetical protein
LHSLGNVFVLNSKKFSSVKFIDKSGSISNVNSSVTKFLQLTERLLTLARYISTNRAETDDQK